MKEEKLLNLRKLDCDLEGHPTPVSDAVLITVQALSKYSDLHGELSSVAQL